MKNEQLSEVFVNKQDRFGKIFSCEDLSEDLFKIYEVALDYGNAALEPALSIKNGKKYNYLIKYVEGNTLNAFTCDELDGSIIGINNATPLLLFFACTRFARYCNPYVALPFHKDMQLLVKDKKILTRKLSRASITKHHIEQEYKEYILSYDYQSLDQLTIEYGLFLYDISIRFLIMHECFHIIMGHTAYVRDKLGLAELFEFSQQRETALEPDLGQTLEFIVDRHVCRGVLAQTLLGNASHNFAKSAPTKVQVPQEEFITRSVTMALCVLFHLYPVKFQNNLSSSTVKTHPHPYIRMQWAITEMAQEVNCNRFEDYFVKPFGLTMGIFGSNFGENQWIHFMREDMNMA
ncbi:MAG: hypothetical protein AAFN93_22420, partial [Bacteroidota bacterium]